MEQLVIHGGHPLRGHVKIGGAKNAVLPIIAAALLGTNGKSVLDEVPALEDVYTITAVLRTLGVTADYTASEHRLVIDASHIALGHARSICISRALRHSGQRSRSRRARFTRVRRTGSRGRASTSISRASGRRRM